MKEQIEAVQRMQDYIAAHLEERITLAALAGASLFSPWYCYRLFRQYTGLSPANYVRRLRLSRSALRLRDGADTVADVAFSLGFGSVDGYQRAFFRAFGCNPAEYAANPIPLGLFTPYGVKYRELRKETKPIEPVKTVFVHLVEKPARKAVIKRGMQANEYFAYCEEVGCDVWGTLVSLRSLAGEPVCMWLPAAYRMPGTSEYVQGIECPLDDAAPIPEGFDGIELPAAKYLMFQGEPFAEEDYCNAIAAVQEAIRRYDPSALGYSWDPTNPRIQLEPVGTRGYIELWPVW